MLRTRFFLSLVRPGYRSVASPKIREGPKNLGWAKVFDFRRITLFRLGYRLSKHKITICSENFFGEHGPLGSRATPMSGYIYRDASCRGSIACTHFRSFEFWKVINDWLRADWRIQRIHKREGQTEECTWKTESKWFYTKRTRPI